MWVCPPLQEVGEPATYLLQVYGTLQAAALPLGRYKYVFVFRIYTICIIQIIGYFCDVINN
nr:hypothetical protein OIUHVQDI_OIUHVQDI_CDS_0004 [Microvirus sp.]